MCVCTSVPSLTSLLVAISISQSLICRWRSKTNILCTLTRCRQRCRCRHHYSFVTKPPELIIFGFEWTAQKSEKFWYKKKLITVIKIETSVHNEQCWRLLLRRSENIAFLFKYVPSKVMVKLYLLSYTSIVRITTDGHFLLLIINCQQTSFTKQVKHLRFEWQ